MITILDRYLLLRLGKIAFFTVLVFTLCWLAPEILSNAIQGVSDKKFTMDEGFAYLLYHLPEVLSYCLPISMLFASVFLFRQISLNGELITVLASGVSFRRVMIPIGVFGAFVSVLFFINQEVFSPWAAYELRQLNNRTQFDEKRIVNPQVTFVEKDGQGTIKKFLVISPTARGRQDKFIFLFYTGKAGKMRISRIVTAKDGNWNWDAGAWQLRRGVEYQLDAKGIYEQVASFRAKAYETSFIPYALLSFPTGHPDEFSVRQLRQYVALLKSGGQTEDAKFYEVRLFQRFFMPIVPVIFALLGTGIGLERTRARRNLGLTYSAVLLLLYNILVPVFTTFGSIGMLPAVLAALLPVLFAVGAGILIVRIRRSEG